LRVGRRGGILFQGVRSDAQARRQAVELLLHLGRFSQQLLVAACFPVGPRLPGFQITCQPRCQGAENQQERHRHRRLPTRGPLHAQDREPQE
jgi:hypothetical protein